jgi:Flp pilus assembly protein TadD
MTPDPDNVPLTRARQLHQQGRNQEAEVLVRRSLAARPDDEWGLRLLAATVLAQDRLDEALVAAQAACAVVPEEPRTWAQLSSVHVGRCDAAAAVTAARQAVQLAPLQAWAHLALGRAHLSRTVPDDATSASDPASALEAADEAVRIDPTNVKALVMRGRALHGLGRRREAERVYATASGLDPTSPTPLNNIGWIHIKRRPLHAARYFTAAISRDPQSKIYRLNLTGVIVMWIFRMVWILLCGGVALAALRWVLPTSGRAAMLTGLAATCLVGSAILYRRLPSRSFRVLWAPRRLSLWMLVARMVAALVLVISVTFGGKTVWTVGCALLFVSVLVEWKVNFSAVARRVSAWHEGRRRTVGGIGSSP